ncbi:hypothetical protein BpHYR1_031120 [Brachionus plicatilis]|uniref:Uncharacterized protein n=1 Tax=Brachionus plicatilis TaxID=10195 RepID=A0A3M7RSE5_BRAPC|nr:hypothetical protein BpHYR1_031120 [Brachionus plicatilis]
MLNKNETTSKQDLVLRKFLTPIGVNDIRDAIRFEGGPESFLKTFSNALMESMKSLERAMAA